jgi:hypothetical protein
MLKTMTPTVNKLIPVALVAALLGGTAGALISRSGRTTETANQTTATLGATDQPAPSPSGTVAPVEDKTALNEANGQDTYRDGFTDGFKAANDQSATSSTTTRKVASRAPRRSTNYSSSRRAYYDYNQPRSRSFWDKHRDKLTVAMGAGGGALLGGLIGGKKGAGIGALAGGGGSALYTYKIRKRNRQY